MKIMCLLLGFIIPNVGLAQDRYQIGVIGSTDLMQKIGGEMVFTDSTFTIKFGAQSQVFKIVNRTNQVVYVTDGTATDLITISPIQGKLKGFIYDYSIVYDRDKRFNGGQVIYFCKKL